MRWLILSLLFSSYTYSQVFVQTFTDRCTGELKTIVIPFEGSTVVAFYNQSRTFTMNDVRSGELQVWLEEVYAWWRTISPCSTNQATTTATQTTTANATQNATAAASSSASTPPQTSSTTNSSSSTESSSGTTGEQTSEGGGDNSTDDSGGDGDSGEGEDSGDDGEDSDDGEKSEEKDSKKQKVNPVIVAANVATMSALDGTVNLVTSVGMSQASLSGVTSDALSLMIWDNLSQFNLNLSRSYTNKEQLVVLKTTGKDKIYGGDVKNMSSSSINLMYSFGMLNVGYGKSKVYLLDRGLVTGWATNFMAMKSGEDFTFLPTVIGFSTKPYMFDRYSISPMLAVAFSPVMYATYDNKISYNSNAMFVIGYSGSFNLTRNFYVNLGANIVESTANLPMTWSVTIGSRFQF